MGLLSGIKFAEALVDLSLGYLLVSFSDGLTEAEKENGELGEAHLLGVIPEDVILR